MATRWNERFFASTRGQVVLLLRQGQVTVEDLAGALGLTDNAVRAHLTALERDGLVVQRGQRQGIGKPAYTYTLTSEAEGLFPKAYGAVLHVLLDVLGESISPPALDTAMREVGRRLADEQPRAAGDLRQRAGAAVALLSELGGLASLEEEHGELVIQGRSCPLAAAVTGHPETCLLAEALLAEVIGAPVRQSCAPEIPRCRFEIGAANTSASG